MAEKSAQQARMIELIKRLAPTEGYTQSALDSVTFMRSDPKDSGTL